MTTRNSLLIMFGLEHDIRRQAITKKGTAATVP